MDQQRRAKTPQDLRGLARPLRRIGGDPHVERLALADGAVESAHRLFQTRVRIDAVGIEDVDVVETHPAEALVEAGEKVLARAVVAVWSRPHVVAGLGRDDQLVAIASQVRPEDPPEVRLGRPGRRAVVVGKVEVGDTAVERPEHGGPLRGERSVVAEVLPEPEGDRGQVEAARADPSIGHRVVAIRGRRVRRCHAGSPFCGGLMRRLDGCRCAGSRRAMPRRAPPTTRARPGRPGCRPGRSAHLPPRRGAPAAASRMPP